MKNNRDILLSGFNFALWAGLYAIGLATREEVLGLGLMIGAFFLVEWPKKSKTWVKYLFLFLANGLFAYSLVALCVGKGDSLMPGLFTAAFSTCYFFQWNGFRTSVFALFTKRWEKITVGVVSALFFGFFALLFLPNFPSINKDFLIDLPGRLYHGKLALVAAAIDGLLQFMVPTITIGRIAVRNK